ncbi:MAG TPA: peptide chain release factor N(5)-glutamine methyltransferase [Rhizomicrobium sp.]|nr:peptide chain release factor N(5)-glutamine methyltransferase [Rhizomicrobium sp.]
MSALRDALARGTERLAAARIDSAKLDARVLLASAMNVSSDGLLAGAALPAAAFQQFETFIARRARREPVAYIVGKKEFWSLDLAVGTGVLVPRPETETLVEQACREFPDRSVPLRASDFGTGSAAILIAFLSEFPNASGVGIDSSAQALVWAERNIAAHRLTGRCELRRADWSAAPDGPFDVLFSNPPYLTQDEIGAAAAELAFEPRSALDGGRDGVEAYRALAPIIAARLAPNGRAFLEIGAGQGEAVSAILAANGLETMRIAPDLAGVPRCVVACLAVQKTLGKGSPIL